MPQIQANDITINYEIEGLPSADLVVLINGLADDRTTWSSQIPALLKAGYQVLSYDNRGIGQTSRPKGPYTAELLADDLHALLQKLDIKSAHFLGISMGGMILQSYALRYPNSTSSSAKQGDIEIKSLTLACTYAQPTPFCSRMFSLWADMAQRMSVQDVMRDVTLWAFTVPFFRSRTEELEEVERAMEGLDMELEAYLAQLNVIQRFDSMGRLEGLRANELWLGGLEPRKVMVLAGKVDILIPVTLSRELAEKVEGCVFRTVKGGHACMVSCWEMFWFLLLSDCANILPMQWEFPQSFNETVIEFLNECKT